jgi:hypothetical protein
MSGRPALALEAGSSDPAHPDSFVTLSRQAGIYSSFVIQIFRCCIGWL